MILSKNIKKNKILINNFLALFTLQGLNYILPLITVPYLVRTLGPEKYGITVFAASFITYFQIISDYGFNFSATRDISINKNNVVKLNEIFNSVMIVKLILTVISFVFLLFIVFSFYNFRNDYKVYIYAYGVVIGNCLFPVWFFQGIEKMKYITYINIIGKSIFTLLIFICVKVPNDYLKVIYLNSLSFIIIGIISLLLIYFKFEIRFRIPKFTNIINQIRKGWYIFTTTFLTNIITSTGTFMLGLFCNKQIVGYYGAIDKITKALVSMFSPVTQAIFPYISSKFKISYYEGKLEVIKFAKYVMVVTTVLCLIIFIFNKNIIFILYGNKYINYSHILKYMSIWIYTSILNNFIGIQYLIGSGNEKYYSKSFTISVIITLILYLLLINIISYNAIIVGSIVGELSLTIVMLFYIKNKIIIRITD